MIYNTVQLNQIDGWSANLAIFTVKHSGRYQGERNRISFSGLHGTVNKRKLSSFFFFFPPV